MSRCDLFLHKGVEGHILFRQDNAEAGDALIGERRGVRSKRLHSYNMASPREACREIARPSARFDAAANSLACFAIANYKRVVFSERRPRSARYFAKLDEAPVGHIRFV